MPRSTAPFRLPIASLILATLAIGCSRGGLLFAPNQPPTLELTSGPIDTSSAHPVAWSVPIAWDARDPDGTIDRVSYAVDPPTAPQAAAGAETVWVNTKANSVVARFRAATLDSLGANTTASDFHVFVARAWDNSGGASEPVVRAFYAYTVAPTARIERPAPDPRQALPVPQTFNITFSGDDPDGIGTRQPAGFLIRLISDRQAMYYLLATDPDSLRREAVATGWRGWSLLPGERTTFTVDNLPDDTGWVIVVAAVDAAGATTPLFSFDRNMVRVAVSLANGPKLNVQGPGINFTYLDGGSSPDSSRWIRASYPQGTRPTFSWSATAATGRQMTGYRWVLDPDALSSDAPRADEATDTKRWSRWSLGTLTTGPVPELAIGVHNLYIQAEDDLGGRSLGIVHMTTFPVGFERPLLIVDDTRGELDRPGTGGCNGPYLKPWPSATELDSFLVAVGGVPWRCGVNPAGAPSVPGLFAGYGADKVETRAGGLDPNFVIPLSLLTHYRHVLWLTDLDAALVEPNGLSGPPTMMRWMSRPVNLPMLEDYSRLGGRVWAAGGGVALASLVEFDTKSNNNLSNTVFAAGTDLWSRSFVVTAAHLRSRILVARSSAELQKSAAAIGGWSGHGPDGSVHAPDYSRLPTALKFRSPATDPLPPTRTAGQANLFYTASTGIEFAQGSIVEEDFGTPGAPRIEPALDTLYDVVGSKIDRPPAPTMFYYHGRDNAPVLFSGFDLWSWSRADCQALVDFVMQDVWGLARTGPGATNARSAGVRASRPARRGLDPVRHAP